MDKQYPVTILNIHLPNEPLTATRSYCLRQMSDTQWATAYYREVTDSFVYGHYFSNIEEAYQEFRTELNQQMKRYDHFIYLFFKYRSYITSQENK